MALFRYETQYGKICIDAECQEEAQIQFSRLMHRLNAAHDDIALAFSDNRAYLEHPENQGKDFVVH